jgi:curved DNA-binding protein CbpA
LGSQYLLSLGFLGYALVLLIGFAGSIPSALSTGAVMALKLLNPGWLPRLMIVLPAYFGLTLRGVLRAWTKHWFKLSFILLAVVYFNATWSAAVHDDPYSVIGASSTSTTKEIRKLCRHKSRDAHPDKNPGREEEVRPLFEQIGRACKTLSDPKKKSKYDRFGIVDTDEQADDELGITGHLGWFGLGLFYSTLGISLPVTLLYNYGHKLKSAEDRLEGAIGSARSLHNDMMALYEYSHYGPATLDFAELYLNIAKWELDDQQQIVKEVSPGSKSSKMSSLCNAHADRLGMWLANTDPEDQKLKSATKKLQQDWFDDSKAKSS